MKRGVKEVVKALRKDVKGCVPGTPPHGFTPKSLRPDPTAARRPTRLVYGFLFRNVSTPHLTLHFFGSSFPPRSPLRANRLCVIAGDISPIDVITHIPILCEEMNVPYIYVHSKEELGAAGQTKRPTSCMLVLPDAQKGGEKMSSDDASEFKDMYGKVVAKIKSLE